MDVGTVFSVQGVEWAAGPEVGMSVLVDTEQNLKQQERQREAGTERGRDSTAAGPSRSTTHRV